MRNRKSVLIILFTLFLSPLIFSQNIVVDDTFSATQLVQNVLLNNSGCATSSNATVTGDNFSSGEQSYGKFTYSGTDFPFSSGVVLSTSRAHRTAGPNIDLVSEGSTSWLGDSDLEQALTIGGTINATSLEFDFTPLTSQISFDYIFASEEYHDAAPCTYSDGFAFLLKVAGSTTPYQNLALIPNTTIPVKVTSVHPDIPGSCVAENETYFGSYNGPTSPINLNGQTVKMTAKSNVIPNVTYHIKLVIADEQNYKYDSAIFLGGGSFNVGTNLGPDRLVATNNPLCNGETYLLTANETGTNSYKWYKNGMLQTETSSSYLVSSPGVYSVEIVLGNTICTASGSVTIEYANPPVLATPVTLIQCDDNNDGYSIFNLTKLDSIIKQNATGLSAVTYYLNQYDATNQNNPIVNPSSFENTATNSLVARVTNSYGCPSYATVLLQISNNALPVINSIIKCDDDGTFDGITILDLSTLVTPQILSGLQSGLFVEYYASIHDAITQVNLLSNNFTNTTANNQTIYARIINGPDCYGIIPIPLQIVTFNVTDFSDHTVYLCESSSINLSVASGFNSYLWSTGAILPSITTSETGIKTVTVTNSYGCKATKKFIVVGSSEPSITVIDISGFSGNENSVLITVSGSGVYEYSLNGTNFQDSPFFSNVLLGEYNVIVRDKNGCGTASQTIVVLDYPKFFTPNGDGINDTWRIKNLNSNETTSIFDRFGKLIYTFNGTDFGWNGLLNFNQMPATDYWFVTTLETGKIVKGHFSLKR